MKIIVAGGGKVGKELCIDLAAENHDIILIDTDSQVVDQLVGSADIKGVVGNGANLNLQQEIGVAECDVFIAVTASDDINIISCIIAHNLGVKTTLARVRNPEYSSNLKVIQESLGINLMVNPEMEAARAIERSIRFPSAISVDSFAGGKVQIVGVRISSCSRFSGMKLNQFRKFYSSIIVCTVKRGDEVYIPRGNFVLEDGDLVYVTGETKDLDDIYREAGCLTKKIRSAMVVGGNRIARYLLELLEKSPIDICVIDHNESVSESLADSFPRVKVITGDGTDHIVLEEHNLEKYDCFVALTGIDEENLVISLYAAKKKVPKIITKVNRTQLLNIFEGEGLQTVVTPKRLVSDIIIRYIRAMNDTLESKIESMYRIADGAVEAIQFKVLKESAATGIPLRDLRLRENILITYILRENELIFPGGSDIIKPGDRIIAVTKEHEFDEIDDLLVDEARK